MCAESEEQSLAQLLPSFLGQDFLLELLTWHSELQLGEFIGAVGFCWLWAVPAHILSEHQRLGPAQPQVCSAWFVTDGIGMLV